jgi:hypothetical protein
MNFFNNVAFGERPTMAYRCASGIYKASFCDFDPFQYYIACYNTTFNDVINTVMAFSTFPRQAQTLTTLTYMILLHCTM